MTDLSGLQALGDVGTEWGVGTCASHTPVTCDPVQEFTASHSTQHELRHMGCEAGNRA